MNRLLALFSFILAAAVSQAAITVVEETASNVELKFELRDHALSTGGVSETHAFTLFPGSSVTFSFDDRLVNPLGDFGRAFLGLGNIEGLVTNPSSGSYEFYVDNGVLNFFGSYVIGSTTVNWAVNSTVETYAFRKDKWVGVFTATATSVPDAGSTLLLLGAGMAAVGLARRRRA